jgi:hypothetical protein
MKTLRLLFAAAVVCLAAVPSSARITDTLHVKRYSIYIDSIRFTGSSLYGKTFLTVQSKKNGISKIRLSLLKLTVDSVLSGSQSLTYTYDDTTISITSPSVLNAGDTVNLQVYYHGSPKSDPVFGGFTFSGSYAFNIGVGFQAKPHNLGKAWFPCIDEFTDKSLYEFYITTAANHKAFCNGTLESTTVNPNGTKTYHWRLSAPIPTYLASVAIAPYYTINRSYKGIPMQWAVLPSDSNATKLTFAKIDTAMSVFISSYGDYPWEKVGYVSVPFNGGAMEHATSIHIGKVFVDGTLNYETLWAHELAHMWWGDLVTCETEGDMWINEGFATFNEARFTEAAYGTKAYKDWIRSNHRYVLQFAHVKDGSYLSLKDIPHAYTYGVTVYKKGGDVAHTLRNYMGDASFFKGCKDFMNLHAYGNANSYQLRDALSSSSGQDLTRFFDDWVFTPGFPHFSIDSVVSRPSGGNYSVTVYTRQKAKGTAHIYKMPVECTFTDGTKDSTVVLLIDTLRNSFTFTLPFVPVWTALDRNEKVGDAVSDYERVIGTPGTQAFPETNVSLNVLSAGSGASTVRIEHSWVAPDPFKQAPPEGKISDYHYWTVDGLFSPGFASKATFTYNGSTNQTFGYIDNTLIKWKEDSLVLYYRPDPSADWKPFPGQTLNKGSNLDKAGNIVVDTLRKGQYALGMGVPLTVDVKEPKKGGSYMRVYPNPASSYVTIRTVLKESSRLSITDIQGRLIYEQELAPQEETRISRSVIGAGIYFVNLEVNSRLVDSQKLVLRN